MSQRSILGYLNAYRKEGDIDLVKKFVINRLLQKKLS